MTRKSKRKARKPRDLWASAIDGAYGARCVEEASGQRIVSTSSTYFMGWRKTRQCIAWLQRAMEWQRSGR